MKTLKKTFMIITILLVAAIGFLWYMGTFGSVKAEEREEGGYTVVGKEIIGPYSKAGQHISDVDARMKELGIISTKGFGIYYDDPKTTPKEKCRSFVGNILEEKDFNRKNDLQSKGLKIDSIPKTMALVIEFPLKNMMSYMIGPMKAYPVFSKIIEEKKLKPGLTFEIYDPAEKKIIFVMQYTL